MNRRDLLKGAAVASVAAAVPAAALAKSAPDRTAWNKAMAAYNSAVAASDAFDPKWERVANAYQAAVERVPHIEVPDGQGGTYSTANAVILSMARRTCQNVRYVETCAYESLKVQQLLVDAADKRDARLEQIKQRYRWDEVNEHYDALSAAISDAETVLLNMPAPDGEALLWKINRLYSPGDGIWAEGVEDQTYADLQRFLSHGRA